MAALWSHRSSDLKCWNSGFWAFTIHVCVGFRCCRNHSLSRFVVHTSVLVLLPVWRKSSKKVSVWRRFLHCQKACKAIAGLVGICSDERCAYLWSLSCLSNLSRGEKRQASECTHWWLFHPKSLWWPPWIIFHEPLAGSLLTAALYVPDLCLLAGAMCPSMDSSHPVLLSMRRCSELEPSLRVTLSVPILGIMCSTSPFSLWPAGRVPTLHHHLSFWLKKLKFSWKGQFWCWWIPGTRFTQL